MLQRQNTVQDIYIQLREPRERARGIDPLGPVRCLVARLRSQDCFVGSVGYDLLKDRTAWDELRSACEVLREDGADAPTKKRTRDEATAVGSCFVCKASVPFEFDSG